MRTAFAASLFVAAVASIDIDDFKFMQYLSKHAKAYETMEQFNIRKGLYMAMDTLIEAHNSRPANFTLGHNFLSDWT